MKSENATRNTCIDQTPVEEHRSQDGKSILCNFCSNYSLHTKGSGVAAIRDIDFDGEGEIRSAKKNPRKIVGVGWGKGTFYKRKIGVVGRVHPSIFQKRALPYPPSISWATL